MCPNRRELRKIYFTGGKQDETKTISCYAIVGNAPNAIANYSICSYG